MIGLSGTVPMVDSGIYRINFRQRSELNQRHPFTTVWVDRWSGQIKEVRNPAKFSKGETFASWIWPFTYRRSVRRYGPFCLVSRRPESFRPVCQWFTVLAMQKRQGSGSQGQFCRTATFVISNEGIDLPGGIGFFYAYSVAGAQS